MVMDKYEELVGAGRMTEAWLLVREDMRKLEAQAEIDRDFILQYQAQVARLETLLLEVADDIESEGSLRWADYLRKMVHWRDSEDMRR